MNNKTLYAFVAMSFLAVSFTAPPAYAKVTAHFRAESVDGGCVNGDSEPIGAGNPDREFRIGIFDETGLSQTCAAGCTADDGNPATADVRTLDYCIESEGCGLWNFADQTISKVIPPGGGVRFYFGMFDDDAGDASDSLGDHWFFTGLPRTNRTESNNNNSPYYADNPISTVCSQDVEGISIAGNYQLTYSNWFTDDTGPSVAASTPFNADDSLNNVNDNDPRLDWQWGAATDLDSGIDAYHFTLEDLTAGTTVFSTQSAPLTRAMSFCASGCTRAYTPVHGHSYRLRIRATNGSYPELQNPTSTWSAWSSTVTVDLVDPVATITAPSAGSWHNGSFSVDFDDADSGVGVDPASCQWQVTSDGTVTSAWTGRTCDASRTVTVGPGDICDVQGVNACFVETRNTDGARRQSLFGSRAFGIDWTEDATGPVAAFTTNGGVAIAPAGWTTDRDPYFSWPASASISPIVGYSWALDASPDCGSTEVAAADPLEVQLTAGRLTDGVHEFQIRAVDAAGNCGPVATRIVQVDATADAVTGLRAADGAGAPIAQATWQTEDAPTMTWDAAASAAPIVGYSVGTGLTTDCTVDTTSTSTTLGAQADGVVRFWVRAVDAAGNCGAAATFDVWVDTTADPIVNLRALTQQAGMPIMSGVAQSDTDPWMEWDVPISSAPIAGYAWGTGATTDCTVDTLASNVQLAMLPEGTTTFWVRAVDTAGNCGPAATFDIVVGSCGDAVVTGSEECEDGNDDDTDACVACMNAVCGDGAVWDGNEACDDGGENSDTEPDACRTDCTAAFCGDGVVDSGEGCDEGEANADDATATCRTTCALATCGDGIVDAGEECDDGALNSDVEPGACRTMCLLPVCGDGVVDPDESCDDADLNSDTTPDACRADCSTPTCGDAVIDDGEVCDDGEQNSDEVPDACRTNCVPAYCGDAIVDSSESCEPPDSQGDLICLDDCRYGPDPDPDPTTMPDAGFDPADVGYVPDLGPVLVESGVGGCCRVAGSGSYSWEVLLLLPLLLLTRRRFTR